MKTLLTFCVTAFSLAAVAMAAENQEIREQIEAAEQKWVEAFNKHDGDALADLYASDAQSFQQDIGIIKGQEAIRKHFTDAAKGEGDLSQTVVTLDVFPQGDLATETGTWQVKNGDESTVEDGTYMMVWQKKGDDWKVLREIWNKTSKKVKLMDSLQPVERLLGSWVAEVEIDGGKLRVTATYQPGVGGAEVNGEGRAWLGGKLIDEWSEHIFYKPETKTIADVTVSKAAGYSEASVSENENTLVFQETGADNDGALYMRVTELKFDGNNKITATQPWGVKAGKPMNDLLKDLEIKRAE